MAYIIKGIFCIIFGLYDFFFLLLKCYETRKFKSAETECHPIPQQATPVMELKPDDCLFFNVRLN